MRGNISVPRVVLKSLEMRWNFCFDKYHSTVEMFWACAAFEKWVKHSLQLLQGGRINQSVIIFMSPQSLQSLHRLRTCYCSPEGARGWRSSGDTDTGPNTQFLSQTGSVQSYNVGLAIEEQTAACLHVLQTQNIIQFVSAYETSTPQIISNRADVKHVYSWYWYNHFCI